MKRQVLESGPVLAVLVAILLGTACATAISSADSEDDCGGAACGEDAWGDDTAEGDDALADGLDVSDVAPCVPDCSGRICGPDPRCGQSCGLCVDGELCNGGRCFEEIPVGPELDWVAIPQGTYVMGIHYHERPRAMYPHDVTIPPFEMSRTEVTVAQYRRCRQASGGCTEDPDDGDGCLWGDKNVEDHPVNCVDWNQARAFCAWAGGRLPSESEWEYAARSLGLAAPFPWGEDPPDCDRTVMATPEEVPGCGEFGPARVCSRPSGNSNQELCDLAGNVGEWTEDDLFDYSEESIPDIDLVPAPPADGSAWVGEPREYYRVVRGGNYLLLGAELFQNTFRSHARPDEKYEQIGFRCVR